MRTHAVNRGASYRTAASRPAVSRRPTKPQTLAPTLVWVTPMPSEPNATCPKCGAPVYFWKNQAGSKVWFDAPGKPWPKHPCLDVPALSWNTRAAVMRARECAEGPVPAARQVEIAGSDGAGCGCLLVVLAVFLFACVINWWRLVIIGRPGDGGVWGTVAATAFAVGILVICERSLTASMRRRALHRSLLLREKAPLTESPGDPTTS